MPQRGTFVTTGDAAGFERLAKGESFAVSTYGIRVQLAHSRLYRRSVYRPSAPQTGRKLNEIDSKFASFQRSCLC
jgi:hypothetical protein